MPFLSQYRFPRLWNAFQYFAGGTVDKRRLCLKYYQGEKTVLEVGCSLGNISKAFIGFPDIRFTGLDIDPVVINFAKKKFKAEPGFTFICQDLRTLAEAKDNRFDYILFAGICHHISSQECLDLLKVASHLLTRKGRIVIVDPLMPKKKDSWFVHRFIMLEQGCYLRSGDNFLKMLKTISGVQIKVKEECLIGSCPLHWPICARFGVYLLCL